MMTSQILKPVNFTKTQKSRYLKNETFFLQNEKIHELHIKGCFIAKNSFVAKVTPTLYINVLSWIFLKNSGKNKDKLRTIPF